MPEVGAGASEHVSTSAGDKVPLDDAIAKSMNPDLRIILDTVIGFTIVEAVIKPLSVRAMKRLMCWIDSHVYWIPDWLYHPLKKD